MANLLKGLLGAIVLALAWVGIGWAMFRFLSAPMTFALIVTWLLALYLARLFKMGVWSVLMGYTVFMLVAVFIAYVGGHWTVWGRNIAPGLSTKHLLVSAGRAAIFVSPVLVDLVMRYLDERRGFPAGLA